MADLDETVQGLVAEHGHVAVGRAARRHATTRPEHVLAAVRELLSRDGHASEERLAEHLDVARGSVRAHLDRLEAEGRITRVRGARRSIALTEEEPCSR